MSNTKVQRLVPLQSLNSKKIVESIQDLIFFEKTSSGAPDNFEDNLTSIIMESVADFQSCLNSLSLQTFQSLPSHVDICLLTNHQHLKKEVAKVMKENKIKLIKKVQIVHISSISSMSNLELQVSQQSTESEENEFNEMCGYIEVLHFQNSLASFQQFFKSWLVDSLPDDVQLCINFNLQKENGMWFSLKCDLCDVLINPLNFPKGKLLMLETCLNVHNASTAKSKQFPTLSIYNLKPRQFIRSHDVCESVLYGLPNLLKPATCWKLEWEELEKNQSYFMGVNAYLEKEGLTLLLEQPKDGICSYFLLLPSSGNTMLIKSIAINDIIMPHNSGLNARNISIPYEVDVQMSQIEVASTYNPFNFSSGLYITQNSFIPKSMPSLSNFDFEDNFYAKKRAKDSEEIGIMNVAKKHIPNFSYHSLVKKSRSVVEPLTLNGRSIKSQWSNHQVSMVEPSSFNGLRGLNEKRSVLQFESKSSSFPSQL